MDRQPLIDPPAGHPATLPARTQVVPMFCSPPACSRPTRWHGMTQPRLSSPRVRYWVMPSWRSHGPIWPCLPTQLMDCRPPFPHFLNRPNTGPPLISIPPPSAIRLFPEHINHTSFPPLPSGPPLSIECTVDPSCQGNGWFAYVYITMYVSAGMVGVHTFGYLKQLFHFYYLKSCTKVTKGST